MKRMFVRYVSHEIRTPLNIVLMGLKLLKRELGQGRVRDYEDDSTQETLHDIETSCEIAVQTLNGLLDYEKLESGIMKLEKAKVAAWPLITETVQPFRVQVRGYA